MMMMACRKNKEKNPWEGVCIRERLKCSLAPPLFKRHVNTVEPVRRLPRRKRLPQLPVEEQKLPALTSCSLLRPSALVSRRNKFFVTVCLRVSCMCRSTLRRQDNIIYCPCARQCCSIRSFMSKIKYTMKYWCIVPLYMTPTILSCYSIISL